VTFSNGSTCPNDVAHFHCWDFSLEHSQVRVRREPPEKANECWCLLQAEDVFFNCAAMACFLAL